MTIVLRGDPRTKKNSMQLIKTKTGTIPIPSKAYSQYERDCLKQITGQHRKRIDYPVNVACVYYMQTRRRVDLVNLMESTLDILVKAGVLADDNSKIVAAHDGCRVCHDKYDPRAVIIIRPMDPNEP